MQHFNDRNAEQGQGAGDSNPADQATIELLKFEIATWEFNQERFASQLPDEFLSLRDAVKKGTIPEFMILDAASHPVLFVAVKTLIKKEMGPIFQGVDSDNVAPSEQCEYAYRVYAGAVPQLLRAYVDASQEKRDLEFGKWFIAPDMRVDEVKLIKLFEGGRIGCDELVEALSSPHGYKHVLKRNSG